MATEGYKAPDKRPYANFSKVYVSFYIQKVMVLYKETLKCDVSQNPIYCPTIAFKTKITCAG